MTAPALILLAGGARNDASALTLQRLTRRLRDARASITCHAAFAGHHEPRLGDVVAQLAAQGHREAVCVPLDCAHLSAPDPTIARAVADVDAANPDITLSVADSVGAPAPLLSLVDARLRDALGRCQRRELDALVLLHDGSDDATDNALLLRRARAWSHRHHLAVTVAGLHGHGSATTAVGAHAAAGRRHIGVGWLSVLDSPSVRTRLASHPRVAAVAPPLDADAAVVDAVLASYSVAALRALSISAAVA